ncbi:hypothetical protein EV424DRAFT_1542945 [Suillus variegatus]|nr:hypothetical protein EV424DRAFT_1542945 [Suillus variegatus]
MSTPVQSSLADLKASIAQLVGIIAGAWHILADSLDVHLALTKQAEIIQAHEKGEYIPGIVTSCSKELMRVHYMTPWALPNWHRIGHDDPWVARHAWRKQVYAWEVLGDNSCDLPVVPNPSTGLLTVTLLSPPVPFLTPVPSPAPVIPSPPVIASNVASPSGKMTSEFRDKGKGKAISDDLEPEVGGSNKRKSPMISGHSSQPPKSAMKPSENWLCWERPVCVEILEHGANVTAESETVWTDYMGSSKAPLTAKKLKNKGWPHYVAMKELLPSGKTRGSHAFYTRMPADNAALVGAPSHATSSHLPDGISYDEANILNQEEALNDIKLQDVDITMMPPPSTIMTEPPSPFDLMQWPAFTPSTPGTSTIASGKQKAAGESGDNMRSLACPPGSTKSASESGKSVKSPCVAVPEAFQSMSKEIHNLSTSFNCATDVMHEHATQVASHPTVDPITVRKQKAIIQLQKEGLEDHEIVEIIKHFQADVAIADLYLVIEKESIRKLFLLTYLK